MNVLKLLEARENNVKKISSSKGGEYCSPCPGCGGTDRFHVWPDQNNGSGSYWCRQCNKAGDSIQFLMDFDGLTFPAACEKLGRVIEPDCRIVPKKGKKQGQGRALPGNQSRAPNKTPDRSAVWNQKAEKFVSWAEKNLSQSPETIAYLESRGISAKTAAKFRLGLNPGDRGNHLFRPRESWGLPTVMKNNRKKKLWLPAGLVIPLLDSIGAVSRIRIRLFNPSEKEPRYYVVPGSSMDVFFISPAREVFVIVEAELDAILIHQAAGDIAGVCGLGTSSRRPDYAAANALAKSLCILNAMDSDAAGKKASVFWTQNFPQAERWPVPEGKDPGEAFAAGVDIRKWIIAGLPPRWQVAARAGSLKKSRPEKIITSADPAALLNSPADFSASKWQQSETLPGAAEDPRARITRLGRLMAGHPITILVRPKCISLDYPDQWSSSHWSLLGTISELVYFDSEIFSHLKRLPVGRYSGRRFI